MITYTLFPVTFLKIFYQPFFSSTIFLLPLWTSCMLLLTISWVLHFNRKMKLRKGNTQMKSKYLLFPTEQMNDLFDVKDVWISKEIWQMVIWCLKVICSCSFHGRGISLGKGFLVANSWGAPVQKRSALNFSHAFLTRWWTKTCLYIFWRWVLHFYCSNLKSFESVFSIKRY